MRSPWWFLPLLVATAVSVYSRNACSFRMFKCWFLMVLLLRLRPSDGGVVLMMLWLCLSIHLLGRRFHYAIPIAIKQVRVQHLVVCVVRVEITTGFSKCPFSESCQLSLLLCPLKMQFKVRPLTTTSHYFSHLVVFFSLQLLWRSVTTWIHLLEFVKLCSQKWCNCAIANQFGQCGLWVVVLNATNLCEPQRKLCDMKTLRLMYDLWRDTCRRAYLHCSFAEP